MSEWLDASEVASLIKPGHRVYIGGSSNEPQALVEALKANPACAEDVTFIQQPLVVNKVDFSMLHTSAKQETFFATPALKEGLANGDVAFIPMQMRAVFSHIQTMALDVALLAAARDVNGVLRYGPNVDYAGAALTAAKCKIVEVSSNFVAPLGAPAVDEADVDYLVASNSNVMTYPIAV